MADTPIATTSAVNVEPATAIAEQPAMASEAPVELASKPANIAANEMEIVKNATRAGETAFKNALVNEYISSMAGQKVIIEENPADGTGKKTLSITLTDGNAFSAGVIQNLQNSFNATVPSGANQINFQVIIPHSMDDTFKYVVQQMMADQMKSLKMNIEQKPKQENPDTSISAIQTNNATAIASAEQKPENRIMEIQDARNSVPLNTDKKWAASITEQRMAAAAFPKQHG